MTNVGIGTINPEPPFCIHSPIFGEIISIAKDTDERKTISISACCDEVQLTDVVILATDIYFTINRELDSYRKEIRRLKSLNSTEQGVKEDGDIY